MSRYSMVSRYKIPLIYVFWQWTWWTHRAWLTWSWRKCMLILNRIHQALHRFSTRVSTLWLPNSWSLIRISLLSIWSATWSCLRSLSIAAIASSATPVSSCATMTTSICARTIEAGYVTFVTASVSAQGVWDRTWSPSWRHTTLEWEVCYQAYSLVRIIRVSSIKSSLMAFNRIYGWHFSRMYTCWVNTPPTCPASHIKTMINQSKSDQNLRNLVRSAQLWRKPIVMSTLTLTWLIWTN